MQIGCDPDILKQISLSEIGNNFASLTKQVGGTENDTGYQIEIVENILQGKLVLLCMVYYVIEILMYDKGFFQRVLLNIVIVLD